MIHHKMPVKLLEKAGLIKPWKMESVDARGQPVSPFYRVTTLGVLQYVPVACFCAAMATVLELLGVYHEAKISLKSGWLYLVILRNLSQFVALYSLVMFYHGSKKLLYELRPLPKFLSIKLVYIVRSRSLGILPLILQSFEKASSHSRSPCTLPRIRQSFYGLLIQWAFSWSQVHQ